MLHYSVVIQWLKEEFLGYLSDWEESINKRDGYSDEEKAKMIISQDTLKGLRMTGKLFTTWQSLFIFLSA